MDVRKTASVNRPLNDMSVTTKIDTYVARRAVLTSPKPIEAVLAKLNQELNKEIEGQVAVTLATATSRAEIDSKFAELYEGGRDFVLFNDADHSRWLNIYFAGEHTFPTTHGLTFGQPLLAKEMLKVDLDIGLFVPPRALVQEIQGGGTRIVYQLPTSWLGDPAPEGLREVMQVVETKMEVLFSKVLS